MELQRHGALPLRFLRLLNRGLTSEQYSPSQQALLEISPAYFDFILGSAAAKPTSFAKILGCVVSPRFRRPPGIDRSPSQFLHVRDQGSQHQHVAQARSSRHEQRLLGPTY